MNFLPVDGPYEQRGEWKKQRFWSAYVFSWSLAPKPRPTRPAEVNAAATGGGYAGCTALTIAAERGLRPNVPFQRTDTRRCELTSLQKCASLKTHF